MSKKTSQNKDDFRDYLSTVDASGKRTWLYPKKPKGKLFDFRKYISYILLAVLFITPFIKINGEPLFLFNVFQRKFIVFGQIFLPQDSHLFGLGFVMSIVFIVVFTTIFGRIWCGWLCPQTIFMEMLFRRIEFWIEGDANKQKRLNKQEWNAEKIRKKGLKYFIFIVLSWLIAHMVVSWIIGVDAMKEMLITNPKENTLAFVVMMILTFLIYGVYMRFREQMCTTFCPYGRLQGVMLGKDSIVVAYDYSRGEPKGRKNDPNAGDCIDCNACVHVCPTGIDIRNGTQLECINCTACIDACDDIMLRLKREPKLIGYYTEENIVSGNKEKFSFSLRQKAYIVAMTVIVGAMMTLLFTRGAVDATILRNAGFTYNVEQDGRITNMYKLSIANKTTDLLDFNIETSLINAELKIVGGQDGVKIEKGEVYSGIMLVTVPKESLQGRQNAIEFIVIDQNAKVLDKVKSSFLGPQK